MKGSMWKEFTHFAGNKICFSATWRWKRAACCSEEFKDIPFRIKRVYYLYATADGVVRGQHAHKCLQQILVCIHGSCKVRLDNGKEKKIVPLERPYEGVYVANNMWREMYDFSSDAVLLVLASELYDESDYIRNYDEFLDFVKNCGNTVGVS